MYQLVKAVWCYDNLSIQNKDLCPDKSFYVETQKNGRARVRVFDGACIKPMLTARCRNLKGADEFVKDFVQNGHYCLIKEQYFNEKDA